MNYKIVDVLNNNVTVEFGGIIRTYSLPIINERCPVGNELDSIINGYIANYYDPKSGTGVSINNEAELKTLITSKSDSVLATEARFKRTRLIRLSDWTQGADAPLDLNIKAAWAVYRQALRDITLQSGFPVNIVWPTEPV